MNTKKYIEDTLISFLEKKEIDKIKVNEIIKEVGSCKGTFYKYYQDKYELLLSCFKNNIYSEILTGCDNWETFIMRCLETFQRKMPVVLNSFGSKDVNSIRFYHEKIFAGFLENDIIQSGEKLSPLSRFSVQICASGFTDIIIRWLESGMKETKEELIDYMKAAMPQSIYPKICVYGLA